jgi:RimJ/RimL family protein N-acetyltransferase
MRYSNAPIPDLASVILRPVELSDIPAWYDYLALPHVVEHTSWNVKSGDDLRPIIECYNSADPASAIRFAIQASSDGAFIGTIGFHTISTVNRTAELAFDLHPSWWGQGIAASCCRAALVWGFSERQFVRIQATALDTNTRSSKLLEKCGFVFEGKLRNYRIVRGSPRDFNLYATVPGVSVAA